MCGVVSVVFWTMGVCGENLLPLLVFVFVGDVGFTMASGLAPGAAVRGAASHKSGRISGRLRSGPVFADEELPHELALETTLHNHGSPPSDRRSRRAVTAIKERVWPNATIPYVIGNRITDDILQHIYQAMEQWEKHTCIHFVNRTNQRDYILFNEGACGCCSFVGRRGGRQDVALSAHCAMFGVVLHELGHVIGFWHEHSRPDRDNYIDIITDNIMLDKIENFAQKPDSEIDSLGQTYDYNSIMHYRKNTFSKNQKNTIVPKKYDVYIGQRDKLSAGDIKQANLLYQCPEPVCYEEFTATRGSFKTPNYPEQYNMESNCTWVIHTRPGEEVVLGFREFDLEGSANCSFDYVEFREGMDVSGSLIGRLCGHGQPGYFRSSSSLWIRFVSDRALSRRGFLAKYTKSFRTSEETSGSFGSGSWESQSRNTIRGLSPSTTYKANCNKEYQDNRGVFLTPLVPVLYHGSDVQCSWTIDGGSKASRIVIEIHHSDATKTSGNCIGSVYQKLSNQRRRTNHVSNSSSNGSKLPRENGSKPAKFGSVDYDCRSTERLVLDTSKAIVQWSSDVHPAFTASYLIDYDECDLGLSRCEHHCTNTLEGYTCGCRSGYTLHHGGHKCVTKSVQTLNRCGGNLTGSAGILRAGTEPLEDCYFYIHHQPLTRVQLTFTKFAVPSALSRNGTCRDSFVEVLAGHAMHSKGQYCGKKRPPIITSSSSVLAVRTHTSLNKVFMMPYFSAKYVVMESQNSPGRCFYKLKAQDALIHSPGFPRPYRPDTYCVWRLSARRGQRVQMVFDSMDLERTKHCSFDYVEVFDGRHVSSKLLGRFCGRHLPPPIYSSGRNMRVAFVSDGSGSGRGFQAKFYTVL